MRARARASILGNPNRTAMQMHARRLHVARPREAEPRRGERRAETQTAVFRPHAAHP